MEQLWCLSAQVGRAAARQSFELLHHRNAASKSVTGSQKTAGCAKIGCFCSFQSGEAAINLPLHSPVLRGQKEKFLPPLQWLVKKACIQKMLSL